MSPREGMARGASAGVPAFAVLGAALMPKCPLCVAAVLSTLGVGLSTRLWVAPMVRPLALAVAVVAVVLFVLGEWLRRAGRGASGPCGCAVESPRDGRAPPAL